MAEALHDAAAPPPPAEAAVAAPVKALQKGLAALDLLRQGGAVRTTDLAAALGVDKSTASRIAQTLVQAGYAARLPGRRLGPGPKFGHRAAAARRPRIRERARPLLESLVRLTGETAHVAILADDQVLYLDREVPDVMLRVDGPAGKLAPLHCTALGKVFLAFADLPLPAALPPLTARSVTDPTVLAAELQAARADGYVLDDEGAALGVRCAAAPLRDPGPEGEVVAALSISGPVTRIDMDRLTALGELVRDLAARF
jgi:DNA-binding IclR family transcriptional regulator